MLADSELGIQMQWDMLSASRRYFFHVVRGKGAQNLALLADSELGIRMQWDMLSA